MKNAITMQMTLAPPPKGYEYTGEYRPPCEGEVFIHGQVTKYLPVFPDHPCLILKPSRWRANEGVRYYFLDGYLSADFYTEEDGELDLTNWENGNYFSSEAEAKIAAIKIKELLLSL